MTKEVKRNTWSKFCKQFSTANQFRPTDIQIKQKGRNGNTRVSTYPFLGVTLEKKGRLIDGVRLHTGSWNPDELSASVISIKKPDKMMIEKNKDGRDSRLVVQSKDGLEARIELNGERDDGQYWGYVEKVAYSLYERRGYTPGNDQGDWYEAERKVKEVESQFV